MTTKRSVPAVFAFASTMILSLCFVPKAAAHLIEDDDVVDDGGLAAVDGGFAPGEVPPRTVPYEPPTSQPTATETPAPSDWYGQWQQWKANLTKTTGTSFELFLNPSDQFVVTGSGDN